MSYAVKEIFLTLQGEGVHAGRRAVFLRFSGCNLWSGREADRAIAICQFCDTDFVGTNGENGGRYDADTLAAKVAALWGDGTANRYVVITGGEPMLQVDDAIDWVCISPKAGSEVIQRVGDELKLVWPQRTSDIDAMEQWQFAHFLIQPMDMGDAALNEASVSAATGFVMERPKWRLSLQNHKILGLP